MTDEQRTKWDRRVATGLGFLGAFAVLGVLLYLAGIDEFLAELAKADRLTVALVVPVTLGWLLAWGVSLHVVLNVLGTDISVTKSFFVMNGAMFSNNITPFGQAGGEPVTALLISSCRSGRWPGSRRSPAERGESKAYSSSCYRASRRSVSGWKPPSPWSSSIAGPCTGFPS